MFKTIVGMSLGLLIISCNPDKTKKGIEDLAAIGSGNYISSSTDAFINKILGSGEGTIRGFDLGDSISKVKTFENLEQFEETFEHIGYTFSTHDGEVVDVLYYFDTVNTVSEVQLDIYLNTDSVSNNVTWALSIYFTQKYGTPKVGVNQTWQIAENQEVIIKNIATKIDRGLQVNFKKSNFLKLIP
ncbi:MAG: hypothetical protein ACI9K1_002285 [Arcticibacterium sp.]|jgi:hypothetical protein